MAPKNIIIILAIISLTIAGLLFKKNQTPPSFQNISVAEFDQAMVSGDPFVVDVHTPEQKHIPGTDAFIDFTQVKNNLDQFPQDKNSEILVYCRSGNMSLTASQDLIDAGYTNVKNLTGGLNAWNKIHSTPPKNL